MYLAKRGYDVVAVDCAFNGLAQGQRSAASLSLSLSSMVCDLGQYDFPPNHFGMVSVVRFLDRALLPVIPEWIRSGGILFYKTFNKNHLIKHPRFNPHYLVNQGELNQVFAGFEIIQSDLVGSNQEALSSSFIIARKM